MEIIIKKTLFYNLDTNVFMGITECGKKITGENTTRLGNKIEGVLFKIDAIKKKKNNQEIYQIKTIKELDSNLFLYLKNNIGGFRPLILRDILKENTEDELINLIENNPLELTKYKYIGEVVAKKIQKKWKKNIELYELSYELAKLGLTDNMLTKIYEYINSKKITAKKYIEKLENNPYILVDIDNIGFKKADQIALKMGINRKSHFRIEAAIKFVLFDTANSNGDTTIHKNVIKTKIINDLLEIQIENSFYEECLNNLVENKDLIALNENYYSLKSIYDKEMYILETITNMNKVSLKPITKNIDKYIKEQEDFYKITLGEEQKESIKLLNSGLNAYALCGYAGTGKSTVSKIMLNLFKGKNVICSAVSGIATDRIRKASEKPSVILYYLTSPFIRGKSKVDINKIDILLLDEASMINNEQFYFLLKRLEHRLDKIKIIFVGDKAQLPPIGPGNFFSDIIDLNLLPYVELTKIYRQSKDMKLTEFAHDIRNGKIPYGYNGIYQDFLWYPQEVRDFWSRKKANDPTLDNDKKLNYKKIRKILVDSYVSKVPKMYERQDNWKDYIYGNQIITPMKKYALGVGMINDDLQEKLSDKSKELIFGFKKFRLYDKVVQIKNKDIDTYYGMKLDRAKGSYLDKERIYNGMLGMIIDIDITAKKVWVVYPIEQFICCYSMNDLKILELGYAITIHKSQGAEFSNVYMPITYAHYIMLNNKLLYTAITRAKKKCTLVGEKSAFAFACKNNDKIKRNSIIQIKFLEYFGS